MSATKRRNAFPATSNLKLDLSRLSASVPFICLPVYLPPFSRYLQELIMESLGKQLDLQGRRVEQGLTVYGNKGSTDQHASVQQLREDVNAYHQHGVEGGKKAAPAVLALQGKVIAALSPSPQTTGQIAVCTGLGLMQMTCESCSV